LTVRAEGTFRGQLPAFAEVRAWAEAFGAAAGADRGAVLRLVLVLEELFTNTVVHGYGTGEGPVWVALASGDAGIEVTYEDAGPAFNPMADVPPPADPRSLDMVPLGGLGLALVRGLTTSARYARVDDRNRLTLTMLPENAAPTTSGPPAISG
jgi:anti-sigma regulatory factor (Ser/Thr protein kinase)